MAGIGQSLLTWYASFTIAEATLAIQALAELVWTDNPPERLSELVHLYCDAETVERTGDALRVIEEALELWPEGYEGPARDGV